MKKLWPLTDEQRPAVDPGEVVWLSASAGTGKTQVLSARVLRLLLQPDVSPSQVLCLTFTKAGATEMAGRINEVLARWVRAEETALAADLLAIGADHGPEARSRARTLFAEVLDCPGGGLRIDTIHAFAQWLLAAFPHEAGLVPGIRAMEDRDRDLLVREVLADMLVEAERTNDAATLGSLANLSVRSGPDAVEAFLLRGAQAREAWEGPGAWQAPMRPGVFRLLGLPSDASEADLPALCSDAAFDVDALRLCMSIYSSWKTATASKTVPIIADWLAAGPAQRLAGLEALHELLFTKDDLVRNRQHLVKFDEAILDAADRVLASSLAVRERKALLKLADWLPSALELCARFSRDWVQAKARAGFIDFDDQIRQAAALLKRSDLSDWIRYKLDRQFDHILVDEAQDTNAAQWQIIEALTEEFFAGEGAHGDKLRTLFVVGDYKQAIFRFQGTSPENFEAARLRVQHDMRGAEANAREQRSGLKVRTLRELGLGTSFRSAQAVLGFVDLSIRQIGWENFGLRDSPPSHVGESRPGQVTLWQVVGNPDDAYLADDDEGEEGWLARSDRRLADKIAQQVKQWIERGFPLVKGGHRNAGPGDVMVLVRKRKELAGLIVARLHAAGVPVAGVDRLRLAAPLGVRDLMSALRFAAQPFDDLNLACLLTSPLLGWSQDDLLEHGWRPDGVRLWDCLRQSRDPFVAASFEALRALLAKADFEPPQALLHWILTGPWRGRRKLVARLGHEVNDPVDELLNAASAYAASSTPSIQGFLRWFDAGEGELKREASKSEGLVRVMTVHGAKGLQAPIVILADAADNPDKTRPNALVVDDPLSGKAIPLPPLRSEEKFGRIAEAEARAKAEERQEHWRLLYVAMTRTEEALFIAGSLGPKEKQPAPDSWYARLVALFGDNPDWIEDRRWGARLEWGEPADVVTAGAKAEPAELPLLPPWLERPPAPEARPPRPLAPSALGEETGADPPSASGLAQAARRGVLIHQLLERLPEVAPGERKAAAKAWLARTATEFDAAGRAEMAASALAVVENKTWSELFAAPALAEVPIAAVVEGQVVAGTIDRLLVLPDRIRVIDFKTARRPPASLDAVPVAILRQMAAYTAALAATYPGRTIDAALLYTHAPVLIELPAELLALHKPALSTAD